MSRRKGVIMAALLLMTATILIVDSGSGGIDAAEVSDILDENIITISTAEDFRGMSEYSDRMKNGERFRFILDDDIELDSTGWDFIRYNTNSICGYFNGELIGNNHTITINVSANDYRSIINTTCGTVLIKDIVLDISGGPVCLVKNAEGDKLTINNVDVAAYISECQNNDTPYVVWADATVTEFIGCDNSASWYINGYSGVYVGIYYAGGSAHSISFDTCTNSGNITGDNVSMFIGNPSSGNAANVSISGCSNTGSITGNFGAWLFSELNGNTTYSTLNSESNYTAVNGSVGTIESNGLDADNVSIDTSEGVYKVSNGTTSVEGAISYKVTLWGYGYFFEDLCGTQRISITSSMTSLGEASDLHLAQIIDSDRAADRGISVSDGDYTKVLDYYVAYVDNYYVIKTEYDGFSVNLSPYAYLTLYDGSGIALGGYSFSSGISSVTKDYKIVPIEGDGFTFTCDDIVTSGNFNFTIGVRDGFSGDPEVTVYRSTGSNTITPTQNEDGSYSITSSGSDVRVVVSGIEAITYNITYDLENVISSNGSSNIGWGESYTTTLSASSGYTIESITVTMDGIPQTTEGNTVMIADVTGDIVITATAAPVPTGTTTEDVTIGGEDSTRTTTIEVGPSGNISTTITIENDLAYTTYTNNGDGEVDVTAVVTNLDDIDASLANAVAQIQYLDVAAGADIQVTIDNGDSDVSVDLAYGSVSGVASTGAGLKIVNNDGFALDLDNDTITGLTGTPSANISVSFSYASETDMNETQANAVGTNSTVSASILIDGTYQHELDGTATLKVPMVLSERQYAIVYHVDDNGRFEKMETTTDGDGVYFTTPHFSVFMVSVYSISEPEITIPDEEDPYPFIPGSGSGSTVSTTETTSDDNTKIIAAAAAVVVIMLASVALMVMRRN